MDDGDHSGTKDPCQNDKRKVSLSHGDPIRFHIFKYPFIIGKSWAKFKNQWFSENSVVRTFSRWLDRRNRATLFSSSLEDR
jgi:hypothetical protein